MYDNIVDRNKGREYLLNWKNVLIDSLFSVGEPIDVQETENPTEEQINNLHQLFEAKLVELFESHKKYYLKDFETAHLEII